ncbi:hypothetical protein BBP40_012080 [Aspergillus hancockii]|nr:hypothetical protein BBP40_012080 [Aspergillus hancockii]
MSSRYRLVFFAPSSAVSACKAAIFAAGAGRYPGQGNYTECCWATPGTAQFRPGDAANPHIGKVGELEETEEIRVEVLCAGEDVARKAVEALKRWVFQDYLMNLAMGVDGYAVGILAYLVGVFRVHPYEQPSYGVYKMEDF